MDYVFLIRHREVAADGSGERFASVSGACERADHGDGLDSLKDHDDDGRCGHRTEYQREEWFADEVRVVLVQKLFGELHHFHAGNGEALLLEAGENFADKSALDC